MKRIEFDSKKFFLNIFLLHSVDFSFNLISSLSKTYSKDTITRRLSDIEIDKNSVLEKEILDYIIKNGVEFGAGDDTSIEKEKFKNNNPILKKQYSSKSGKVKRCIQIVTIAIKIKGAKTYIPFNIKVKNNDDKEMTKTKLFLAMLQDMIDMKIIPKTMFFDIYYSSKAVIEFFIENNIFFYSKIKGNRQVAYKNNQGEVVICSADEIVFTEEEKKSGKIVNIVNVGKEVPIKLFCVNYRTEESKNKIGYLITNNLKEDSADNANKTYNKRNIVEEMHRDAFNYTKLEKIKIRSFIKQMKYIFLSFCALALLKFKCILEKRSCRSILIAPHTKIFYNEILNSSVTGYNILN